ncbi:hypothetical protein O181_012124 [Austropuccinia psidii MF-1]|uniref:Uncharacterized protein n=1 Tax=Austropuccinia psidii MF-1 TaxID=1389203 RepID=A0A9Q3BU37_9BASI|nr:hypothetical protein [Austropuccinia psidii MF-1]
MRGNDEDLRQIKIINKSMNVKHTENDTGLDQRQDKILNEEIIKVISFLNRVLARHEKRVEEPRENHQRCNVMYSTVDLHRQQGWHYPSTSSASSTSILESYFHFLTQIEALPCPAIIYLLL